MINIFRLHDLELARREAPGTPAEALFAELDQRATRGIDGEFFIDWPEGPRWFDRRVQCSRSARWQQFAGGSTTGHPGSTGADRHSERSEAQLSVIHENVLIATESGVLPRQVRFSEWRPNQPPHYIFEYTAGKAIDSSIVPRSSRTIVRFAPSELEHDVRL